MAIVGCDDEYLKEVMAENLTPSDSIKTPERLFGRERQLLSIDRALNSRGRQVFIFGDRGVGKSSLALTAAFLRTSSAFRPIHVNCGGSGFSEVIQAMGNRANSAKSRIEKGGGRGFGFSFLGNGANVTAKSDFSADVPAPNSLNEALEVVRYIDELAENKEIVIIVDEVERIKASEDKDKLAEFIKNVPSVSDRVKFIFCGIASDLTDLLGAHPSAGRILETIQLPVIPYDSLWKIITVPAEKLGIKIDQNKLIRISQISDGFPHYVHLIGEALFWSMHDDSEFVNSVTVDHYEGAIRGAVQRVEAILRNQYDIATKKTKNTEDYEEALWALADKTSDRRQLSDIYDRSYLPIMMKRTGRYALSREKLNQRLLSLRKESHGRIVVGHGSGWFSFRENIMRGYVRLDAENRNVQLGRTT